MRNIYKKPEVWLNLVRLTLIELGYAPDIKIDEKSWLQLFHDDMMPTKAIAEMEGIDIIQVALAFTRAQQLGDPLKTLNCGHSDCGSFYDYNSQRYLCSAMAQNACARPTTIMSQEIFDQAIRLLRDLADLQNGPPLPTYEKEWQEVMDEIYPFLERWDKPRPATLHHIRHRVGGE